LHWEQSRAAGGKKWDGSVGNEGVTGKRAVWWKPAPMKQGTSHKRGCLINRGGKMEVWVRELGGKRKRSYLDNKKKQRKKKNKRRKKIGRKRKNRRK